MHVLAARVRSRLPSLEDAGCEFSLAGGHSLSYVTSVEKRKAFFSSVVETGRAQVLHIRSFG